MKNPASHLTKMWYFETLLNVFRVLKGFLQHLTALTCSRGFLTMLYQAEMMSFSSWSCLERVLSESCWNTQRRAWDQHHHTHTDKQCVCVWPPGAGSSCPSPSAGSSAPELQQEPRWASAWGPESLWPETHTHTHAFRETVLSLHISISLQSVLTVRAFSTYLLYRSSIRLMSSSFFFRISCSSSIFFATDTHTHRQRVSSSLSDMAEAQMFL